jgi:hypothetical protein
MFDGSIIANGSRRDFAALLRGQDVHCILSAGFQERLRVEGSQIVFYLRR